tara:strand:- start:430 stop:2310 length:1881 start_codon:yes stop_codon:yes gene_type:complete
MSKLSSKWVLPRIVLENEFPNSNIPKPLLAILIRRGLTTKSKINEYFNPPNLPKLEEHFPQLTKAIKRLKIACSTKEKIAICGDYDADGMTSTILITEVLKKLKANVCILIPDRINDGYGLNERMINVLSKNDVKLIITVDNGVSATKALKQASRLNIDVILSDHHKIPDQLEDIYALIHPETLPKDSPYKYLAGVGLSYVIAKCLSDSFDNKSIIENSLDYFCIGTIADMSELKGANRYFLKKALPHLSKTKSKGLLKLQNKAGLCNREINSQDISFKLAPRINSVGRIGDPNIIINLMLEHDQDIINTYANRCEEINKKRKEICRNIELEAFNLLSIINSDEKSFIILFGENWHSGVIGIVASRIVEKFGRPAAVLTTDKDGNIRGSARSSLGFNMIGALKRCKHLLESYGGHKAAAGFTIKPENLQAFEELLIKITNEYPKDYLTSKLYPEAYLCFDQINDEFFKYLSEMEPFGQGNPLPLFWSRGCKVTNIRVLSNNFQILTLKKNYHEIKAVDWRNEYQYKKGDLVDVVYNVEKDHWKKNNNYQLNIKDSRKFHKFSNIILGNRNYLCNLTEDNKIEVKNEKGNILKNDSDLNSIFSGKVESIKYIESLFSLAEIALGERV